MNKLKRFSNVLLLAIVFMTVMIFVKCDTYAFTERKEYPFLGNTLSDQYRYYVRDNKLFNEGKSTQLSNAAYIYGRIAETEGNWMGGITDPNTGNWWELNKNLYQPIPYGEEPMTGAIACYSDHVTFVEKYDMYADKVYFSEVYKEDKGTSSFEYRTKTEHDAAMTGTFLGYIYTCKELNPGKPVSPLDTNNLYIIKNVATGKVLEVPGGTHTKRAWLDFGEYSDKPKTYQVWKPVKYESYYKFVNYESKMAVDIWYNDKNEFSQLIQYPVDYIPVESNKYVQYYSLHNAGDNKYYIISKHNELAVRAYNNNANAKLWEFDLSANQQFEFIPISKTAPTVSDIKISDVDPTGYTLSFKANATYDTSLVEVKIFNDAISDKYTIINPKKSNGVYSCRVNIGSNFNNLRNSYYRTQIHVADIFGNSKIAEAKKTYVPDYKDISKVSMKLSSSYVTYDSSKKATGFKVKVSVTGLTENVDYKLTYTNYKAIGTATVKVTGIGKYRGSKKLTYKIIPRKTKLTKAIPGKKKFTLLWKTGKDGITGYTIQYSTSKDFKSGTVKTKTIKNDSTVKYAFTGLKSKKNYYVRIRTYKTVSGKKYSSLWSDVLKVKTK